MQIKKLMYRGILSRHETEYKLSELGLLVIDVVEKRAVPLHLLHAAFI